MVPSSGPESSATELGQASAPDTPALATPAPATPAPPRLDWHTDNHAALQESYEALKKAWANLHYPPGGALLGDDADGATDGSHPNDLGFRRQAAIFEPVLSASLGK
jgi:lysophospholipase L1-like esterase